MFTFVTAYGTIVQEHDQQYKLSQTSCVITCNNICCYTQGKVTNLPTSNVNTEEY